MKMTEKEKLLNFIDDCIDENIGFKVHWLLCYGKEAYDKEIKYTIDMLSGCKQMFNDNIRDDLTYCGELRAVGKILGYELLGSEDW